MFERGIYLSVFYCLCFVNKILSDMLEEPVLEEIYPDLDEEEDTRITYSMD